MQSKFNFTGILQFNKEESKNPWLRSGKTKNGNDYQTLGAIVVADKQNRGYMELFGMAGNAIKNKDNEGNNIEIAWEDRLDESVISSVRNKQIIRIGEDRYEFITPWDFIEFVKEHKAELEGKNVCVTGRINKNVYNGTISDRFQINNLYVVDDDTKHSLTVTEEIFFNKDSIDTADWKEEKKVSLNGWVEAYDSDSKENKLFPRQLVLDCTKIDFENEKHIKLLQYKLKQMGLKYDDGKIVNNLKAKKIYKLIFVENYVNGSEEIPFDESCLTDNQRESIELGIKTLDDFKPKGSIFGNRVILFKIKDFDLTGDYSDGYVDAEFTEDEFEEKIFIAPVTEESAEDVLDKETKTSDSTDDDDLFS